MIYKNDPSIAAAFVAAASPDGDSKAITRIVPNLVRERDRETALQLVRSMGSAATFLPETLALFNTKHFSLLQKSEMLRAAFPPTQTLQDDIINAWSDCNADIGRIGFSFPQWRFLAQGFDNGPSMLERFGMKKLERSTDIRDASLPKNDPNRDKYGVGFVHHDGDVTIEYRRAYILCSSREPGREASLIVRNNSYFFGRDRLPSAALVSWQHLQPSDLEALDESSFADGGPFVPWQKAFSADDAQTLRNKMFRIEHLLERIEYFDKNMNVWMIQAPEGKAALNALAADGLKKQQASGKTEPIFYLAAVDDRMPPWFPRFAMPANELQQYGIPHTEACEKLLLLSGPDGDFPIKPAPQFKPDRQPVARFS